MRRLLKDQNNNDTVFVSSFISIVILMDDGMGQSALTSDQNNSQSVNADQSQAPSTDAPVAGTATAATARENADGQNVIEILSDSESVDGGKSPVKSIASRENTDPIDKYEPMDIDEILDGIQCESASEQEADEPMHVIDELLGDCAADTVDSAIAEQIDGECGRFMGAGPIKGAFHVICISIKISFGF